MRKLIRNYSGLLVFVFTVLLGSLISPTFRNWSNIIDIVQGAAEIGLLSIGMTFVISAGGSGVDLSVGSNLALGCMAAALTQAMGFPSVLSLLVAMTATGIVGAANGLFITKGRLQPFVATLVTMIGARAMALIVNGGKPVTQGLPEKFLAIARGKIGPVFYPAIIWLVAIVIAQIVITQSNFGRNLMAVGGSEESARYSGINVNRVRIAAYTISGVLAGIAGALLAARLDEGEPRSGTGMELMAIAAVVIGGTSMAGGRGSALGTMFGVLALGSINNLLNVTSVNMYAQSVVRGGIIFVAVLVPFITERLGKIRKTTQ
jgi:ribose/xylose/arabinose/galactoside ABC-type transport system permease subunit